MGLCRLLVRSLIFCHTFTGGGEVHNLAKGGRSRAIYTRDSRLLGLLVRRGRFRRSRTGGLRDGWLRLFRQGGISYNGLRLVGSRLLRCRGLSGRFHLGADILFIV